MRISLPSDMAAGFSNRRSKEDRKDDEAHLDAKIEARLSGVIGEVAEAIEAPPAGTRYRHSIHPAESLRSLGRARGLVRALAERDLRVRYKQAHLGIAWAIISPAILMIVFSLLMNRGVLSVSTGGKPTYLFAYVGLVPWTFFANVVSQGGMSLVSNLYLVNKIFCPREVFPLTSALVCAVDGLVSALLFLILFPISGTHPALTTVWVPVLLVIEIAFTIGVTLIISIVTVYMRDLRHLLGIIVQFGLFVTPVMYSMSNIPGKHLNRLAIPSHLIGFYTVIDPLAPLIDGIRRTVLFGQAPQWGYVGISAVVSGITLIGGFLLFKRLEYGIADVA